MLQHKHHPRPLRLTRIPPPMHRRPLHRDIPSFQRPRHPIIKQHLDLPLQHNPIIEALRTVHQMRTSRRKVHNPTHRAVGIHQPHAFIHDGLVGFHVCVVVEVGWELRGGVRDAEGHVFAVVAFPVAGFFGVDDCVAGGVVAGYVLGYAPEGGDLVGVGHSDG
ncbi:hypothetical protein AWENTII_012901 [Aspergillus wentii]